MILNFLYGKRASIHIGSLYRFVQKFYTIDYFKGLI